MDTNNIVYNPSDYTNYLDTIGIDYDGLVKKLNTMPRYISPGRADESIQEVAAVEHWATFKTASTPYPMIKFVDAFHSYIDTYKTIPTLDEFRSHYYKLAAGNITGFISTKTPYGLDKDRLLDAIDKRCIRSYPSIIRDLQFALLLKSQIGNSVSVMYNTELDTDMAIDIMITAKSGTHYGIHLYTKTPRAEKFRNDKDVRHSVQFSNVISVDYTIDPGNETLNGLALYTQNDVVRLVATMKQSKNNNKNVREAVI